MLVKTIVGSKPNNKIFTIGKNQTIDDAVSDLAAHRVGALVVSDDGKIIDGILSERDIIREMGKRGTTCLTDKVGDMMTGAVSCCAMSDSAQSVLEAMTEGHFRHMPILENGKLAGLISIGDVVKARLQEMANEHSAMVDMIRGV
ncbi:MAG: CBS domain-containing protein [Rhodobacterales bacterium]